MCIYCQPLLFCNMIIFKGLILFVHMLTSSPASVLPHRAVWSQGRRPTYHGLIIFDTATHFYKTFVVTGRTPVYVTDLLRSLPWS